MLSCHSRLKLPSGTWWIVLCRVDCVFLRFQHPLRKLKCFWMIEFPMRHKKQKTRVYGIWWLPTFANMNNFGNFKNLRIMRKKQKRCYEKKRYEMSYSTLSAASKCKWSSSTEYGRSFPNSRFFHHKPSCSEAPLLPTRLHSRDGRIICQLYAAISFHKLLRMI